MIFLKAVYSIRGEAEQIVISTLNDFIIYFGVCSKLTHIVLFYTYTPL